MNARPWRLLIWTVYDHPRDMPEYWAVRVWELWPGALIPRARLAGFRSLDRARAWIMQCNPDAVCLQSFPSDDPVIVESWA